MATVREHYDLRAKALNAEKSWELKSNQNQTINKILGKVSHCIEENAKYWSFYLPKNSDISCMEYLLTQQHVLKGIINDNEPEQEIGFADTPERQRLSTFVFTRRIYIYIDREINNDEKNYLNMIGSKLNYSIKIRDHDYVSKCDELSKPLAFISHDSRDKDSLVRELAIELNNKLCPVWYDEFSLKVGDNLRESIEYGLKETRKCILVISPSFILNKGWTKKEFDTIFSREIYKQDNVILPIWHNVTKKQVYEFSPGLLNCFALQSSIGVVELAKKLIEKIKI